MVDGVESARDRYLFRDGVLADGNRIPHASVEVHLHALAVQAGTCSRTADIAGYDGQRCDSCCVPFAVMVALGAVALRNEAGFMIGDEMGEVFYFFSGKPADGSGPLGRLGRHVVTRAHDVVHVGRTGGCALGQGVRVEADGVLVEKLLVVFSLADDDVGHGAREGAVGTGVDGKPFVWIARRPFAQAVIDKGERDARFARFCHLVHFAHAAHT